MTGAAAGFDAFVSYSQRADRDLAVALRGALHRFARPWYRLRALRVFQDEASLSADPGLWPGIEDALSRSRYLVLLASPEAAASVWVDREVEYWKANKPAEHVLLVVTRGDYVWDDAAADFDWERSDALPRALSGVFSDMPLVVDLRRAEGSDGRFVLSLDTMDRVRLWDTRTGAVRALAPAAADPWVTSVADGRYFAAVVSPGRTVFVDALTGRRTAEVRGDLLRVEGGAPRRPVTAGTDAQGRVVVWDVRTGRVLGRGPSLGASAAGAPRPSVSDGGGTLAVVVGRDRKRALVLDGADASVIATVPSPSGRPLAQVALQPDGRQVALIDVGGRLGITYALDGTGRRLGATVTLGRTVVHDVATGRRLMLCTGLMGASSGGSRGLAFSPRDDTVAVSSQDGTTRLLAPDGRGGCRVRAAVPGSGHGVAFSRDGSLLLTEGDMRLRDTETLETVGGPLFDDAGPLPADLFFTAGGRGLVHVSYDGTVRRLALDPVELLRQACGLAGRTLTPSEWERFGVPEPYEARCR
ncbi:TIR domain-containing protein [Streptomyces sp. NPDC052036]|uniref:TIR domain-containing protein n=1 Tax=Streptomyces sp. NPDC052036 TaxID=3155171 RepID=UPI00343F99D9